MRIPQALKEQWHGEPDWLAELPRLANDCAELWDLTLEEPFDTPHSLVVPAREVVLKLNAPSHVEAEHEADALAAWGGRGAVRLVARDDERRALLLERCEPGTRLWDADDDALAVVGGLLPRLSVEVTRSHAFGLLTDESARWAEEVRDRYERAGRPFERSLVERALDVFDTVDGRASFLVNQDLHGGNILRARREPWLVIDPKPLLGERELDGVGLLRNADRDPSRSPAASVRRWLDAFGALGLDRGRARAWGVAHAIAWGWDERDGWLPDMIETARVIATA